MTFARLIQLLLSLSVVVLLGLLVNTGGTDIQQHDQIMDHLRQLKQLDATLNQHLLKLRYGLLPDYDPVVRTVVELRALRHDLTTGRIAIYHKGQADIDRSLEAYGELLMKQSSFIERFAAENKTFDNSLRNFPLITTELAGRVREDRPDDPLGMLLTDLLQKVLIYNLTVEDELEVEVHRLISALSNIRGQYPPDVSQGIMEVLAQAQTILKQKEGIDARVAEFVSMPSMQRLDELHQAYTAHYTQTMQRANRYRFYLYGLCILLLASLAYIMLKLRESVRLLNKRQQELTRANADLETEIAEHQRTEQRLALQYTLTRVLAESSSLTEAAPPILHAICEHLGCALGVVWSVDHHANVLRCVTLWHAPGTDMAEFEETTWRTTLASGVGLPGRVWASGKPVWLSDIVEESGLPSVPLAANAGLHGALAFPIWSGTAVTGVIEFFSRQIQQPDEDLLQMLSAIGSLLGQFIEHRRLEQQRQEQSEALERSNRELAQQQAAMHSLLNDLQASKKALEAHNRELTRREGITQSLLRDLRGAKERIEEQANTLQAANTKLHELGLLKDDFVAKVSHELRTPLTSIKEGLGLLLDNLLGQTTPDQQDFLKTMDGDIDRLAELINNMLDISKIEAGRMQLARVRVEVPEFIHSLVRSYQPILGQRTVNVECAEVSPVFIDRNRILQVLTNLFSNALKVTQDSGRITFHADQRNDLVAIAVEDNGPGISPEDLPKLFEKFSQVGPPRIERPFGTGLGLTVCKELTELHRGRIEVASEVGRGTTFTVFLPAYTDTFALTESFRELRESVPPSEGQTTCLIAIQGHSLLTPGGEPGQHRQQLERLADDVRQYLHRGDIVLALEPSWIVVLALTDATAVQVIVKRLRERLRDGSRLRFGAAVYPGDGAEPTALFERATLRLDQALTSLEPPRNVRRLSVEKTG
jgi:signal transduction histidine kinase